MELSPYAALELLFVAGAVALAARAAWRQWQAAQPAPGAPKCRACGPACSKEAALGPTRKALP